MPKAEKYNTLLTKYNNWQSIYEDISGVWTRKHTHSINDLKTSSVRVWNDILQVTLQNAIHELGFQGLDACLKCLLDDILSI